MKLLGSYIFGILSLFSQIELQAHKGGLDLSDLKPISMEMEEAIFLDAGTGESTSVGNQTLQLDSLKSIEIEEEKAVDDIEFNQDEILRYSRKGKKLKLDGLKAIEAEREEII